ncbi:MAG TPA: sulfotransferase [Vicinamibacteria bacterium]|nr:sulfotransferase [Vicinamibacteria bacterium]
MTGQASATKVVYILGTARGGTSIFGRVLATLPGAGHGGELRRLWNPGLQPGHTCGCGKAPSDCALWSKLLATGSGAAYMEPSLNEVARVQETAAPDDHAWWKAYRILRTSGTPGLATDEARYLAAFCELYKAFARASSSSVVIDSSKNPADAALLHRARDVAMFCVQIVRDPRGVAFSRRKRRAPDEPTRAAPVETARTAGYWIMQHLSFEAVRRRYGRERALLVRYEDFIDAPGAVVGAVARLVGTAPPASELSVGVPIALPVSHEPDTTSTKFSAPQVVLRPDSRWEKELHALDRSMVTLLTYPLLRRYGYPMRAQPRTDHRPR